MSSLPMHRRAFGFVYDVAGLYFTKRVSRSAAELAYFLVLTFFPVLICVNAIIGTLFVPNFWELMQRLQENYLSKIFKESGSGN